MNQCFRKQSEKLYRFFEHYLYYRKTNNFPDGRGILFQTRDLLTAFTILDNTFLYIEKEISKNDNNHKNKNTVDR